MGKNRIAFLDGYRGIAIFLVILFHTYSRWNDVLPYNHDYSNFFIFKYGFLGVELFFLISGFVILMTLEKAVTFKEFLTKRWLRLFPAMLIASIIIFISSNIFKTWPDGTPQVTNIIPGLLFIDPQWINNIFKSNLASLDGSFWSLYVEVKFYIVFGIAYFTLGRNKAIALISIASVLWFVCHFADLILARKILSLFSFNYFGWFSAGALAYTYYTSKSKIFLFNSISMGLISCLLFINDLYEIIGAIFIYVLFVLPILMKSVQRIIANKFFLFLGVISYPLYLVHQYLLIALIKLYHNYFIILPDLILPIPALIIIVLLAVLITRFLEPTIKNLFVRKIYTPRLIKSITVKS